MALTNVENLVYDHRLSSVVPAIVTGEDKVHELTTMDLAMKLHYIRGIYFFNNESVQGLNIYDWKKAMFECLVPYYPTCGRIRRSENGRPFIKCNDTGVRIVEAKCSKNLNEWLVMKDHCSINDDQLVYSHVLGPDLGFSPLVFVQFTWFKCGGISIGLSWAHILGDAFSASTFINMWGHIISGLLPPHSLSIPTTKISQFPSSNSKKPISLKNVHPVGDHWLTPNSKKMGKFTFQLTVQQLDNLLSKISDPQNQAENLRSPYFEILSAIIWKSLAKIRVETRVVTICRNYDHFSERENEFPSNRQVIGIVEADFAVSKAGVMELAKMIGDKMVDEVGLIKDVIDRENSTEAAAEEEFIVYGGNLTFVNLEETKIYGLELRGKKPVFANYSVDGVGDEGVVLVLPGSENGGDEGGCGRTVNVILPEYEIVELQNELKYFLK